MWQVIDWLLTTLQNLLTGFGFLKGMEGAGAIVLGAGTVIVYFIGVGLIWVFLDYGRGGPSEGQLILQGLIAGGTFLSPIDVVPDVIPALGQADDISIIGLFAIGLLKFFFAGRRGSEAQPRRRHRQIPARYPDEDEE